MTSSPRVLVIDDDPSVRELFADVAREVGFDAVELPGDCDLARPDLSAGARIVLLDLTMPGRDGIEVLRTLAALEEVPTVVLVSGQDRRTIASARRVGIELGLAMGPSLQKPVAVADLMTALISAEEQERRTARPGTAAPPEWHPPAAEIERALANDEFEVHFQPKIGLRGRQSVRVVGAEALVRWRHPDRGLVAPSAFVPLLEATRWLAPFTDIVIDKAIAGRRAWEIDCGPLPVSLNLSRALLADLSFPDRIETMLTRAGLGPDAVMVEITETAAIADLGRAADIVTRLRLKGIATSLDDFGNGAGTLFEIYRLPVAELKIDRSLVAEVARDGDAETVLKALVGLAHALGLSICAEGVETVATAERLIALGCDSAQGFFYSKPLTLDAFVAFAACRPSDHIVTMPRSSRYGAA